MQWELKANVYGTIMEQALSYLENSLRLLKKPSFHLKVNLMYYNKEIALSIWEV